MKLPDALARSLAAGRLPHAVLLQGAQPQALRDAARQFEEAFPGMSRTMIADKLAMTGTEKSVAFDAKGELVAAPAGRKTVSAEPTVAPAADAATDPETTGSDVQEADDEPAPQEPAAEPDTSDDGRPAWASGNY